jgi:ABC-type Zn uptake system ZnuABC Zn-binding protein ZnuA
MVLSIAAVLFSGCSQNDTAKLKVMSGSTLITYIAQQVAGDKVEIVNLIPASQHPGDFNAKPGDIENLAKAKLFLLHGWPGEGYAEKLISSANNPGLTIVKANVNGNWMIPSIQAAGIDKVAAALAQIDPPNAAYYQQQAAAYRQRIQATETELKTRLSQANVSQLSVIASVRQADFLQWAGFKVAATYVSPDALTPQTVKDLVDKGKAEKAAIVVNNLQDSQDAGKGIAEELKIPNINLSNFPGGLDNTETWEKAITKNVDILLDAINK